MKEPLVYFLVVGLMLFVVFDILPRSPADDARSIIVTSEELLPLIMFRNQRLRQDDAGEFLLNMPEENRQKLIEDYVKEEVLYREAIALGLNENNYTARRRLISQLEYINQGFIYESLTLTDQDLQDHYDENKDRYFVAPQITFTHVYFSAETAGVEAAEQSARGKLAELNDSSVAFHLAATHSEHFLYHRNYVNKEAEEVASHFGDQFASRVFAFDVSDVWQGPIASSYGSHLILLSSSKPGYYPALQEVQARVADDVTRIKVAEELARFYQEVRSTYDIEVTDIEITDIEAPSIAEPNIENTVTP